MVLRKWTPNQMRASPHSLAGKPHSLWNLDLDVLATTPEEIVEVLETKFCALGSLVAAPVGDDSGGVAHALEFARGRGR